jgi:FixJ family two-component response regulator
MARLLVVDDEKGIREALVQVFEYEGHDVRTAEDGPDALLAAEPFHPDVIFLDVKMPGMDGLDVLARLRTECPGPLVVMISGHGTIETAIEATRNGAYDFLEKPLDTDHLLVTLGRALELKGLTDSIADLKSQVESRYEIVGTSYATGAGSCGKSRSDRGSCFGHWRKWNRQGVGRTRDPPALAEVGRGVRGGQLCGDPIRADRVGSFWAHEGLVHRSRRRSGG